jgi:hypothetical protein
VDTEGTWATFDFPLHEAGDFDSIVKRWVQVVVSVDGDHTVSGRNPILLA